MRGVTATGGRSRRPLRREARWRGAGRGGVLLPVLLLVLLPVGACDVHWGGAHVSLEDPAPATTERRAPATTEEEHPLPLPRGPFLYLARPDGSGGARVTPVAALPPDGGAPAGVEFPDPLPAEYRARFDAAFLRSGGELTLQRWGRRIGTVVVRESRPPADPSCPSVAAGALLLLPGQTMPRTTIALPADLSPELPERVPTLEPVPGMVRAAPVIAENRIGGERAFLARLASLQAVLIPGDTAPAMAATYLIEDSLAAGPPAGDAVSLFYLAAHDRARGYVTRWSELRRYDTASGKEAFEYLDWASMPSGRLHLLRLYDGGAVRLAAGFVSGEGDGEEPEVEWREEGRCLALARLAGG